MLYEEWYQGQRIFLTTIQTEEGTWGWEAEIADDGHRVAIDSTSGDIYGTEDEARYAARSAAAAAIDRLRTSRGKP
jgi:hypothetical protein